MWTAIGLLGDAMNGRHIITEKEITEWMDHPTWHVAASSYGDYSAKRLEVSNAGLFRVTDHSKQIYLGGDLTKAVTAYNEAR